MGSMANVCWWTWDVAVALKELVPYDMARFTAWLTSWQPGLRLQDVQEELNRSLVHCQDGGLGSEADFLAVPLQRGNVFVVAGLETGVDWKPTDAACSRALHT
jgi:hypothetical protein